MERLLQILDIRHSGRELNLERKQHPCGVELGKSRADFLWEVQPILTSRGMAKSLTMYTSPTVPFQLSVIIGPSSRCVPGSLQTLEARTDRPTYQKTSVNEKPATQQLAATRLQGWAPCRPVHL